MNGIPFTKERLLNIYARVNETSMQRTFTFLNSDLTAHSIATYNFSFRVKKSPSSETVFELTVGDGLTVSVNALAIQFSEANLSQDPGTYFWTLYANSVSNTWIGGWFYMHEGEFDGVASETISLTVGDVTINV